MQAAEYNSKQMTTNQMRMNSRSATALPARAANVALWILQASTALVFLLVGSVELAGFGDAVKMFGDIGFGQWFRYLAAVLEIAGAILVLVPSLATLSRLCNPRQNTSTEAR